MPVARCKLTNVWPCSHDGVKTLYQQGVRRAAGDYVGTNLIDVHWIRYGLIDHRPPGDYVGTNLIDGHDTALR